MYKAKQKAKFVGVDEHGVSEQSKFDTGEGQQMETMYASTIQRFEERNEELQQSTFEVGGVKYKDSDQMSRVKMFQQEIADFMQQEVDTDGALFLAQANNLVAKYLNLIANCKDYIASHKHPITSSGKARLRLVKGTLSLAQQEYDKFSAGRRELRKEALQAEKRSQKLVWGNILGIMRGSDFDLDKMKGVGTEGAMTSELQVITSGKSEFYFKEEEKLEEPLDAYKTRYLNDNVNKQDREIYQKVWQIVQHKKTMDNVIGKGFAKGLKEAKTQADLDDMYRYIQKEINNSGFPAGFLDLNDQKVREILRDVLPRFEMWENREIACKMAGIEMGESLSVRNVLTSRMAIIMDMPHLMALSNTATLHRGGLQKREGIVMEKARGIQHMEVLKKADQDKKKIVYTPEALRQFSCLQLFDTICGQTDRHYGNRFVTIVEEEKQIIITGVQGIDHDLSFGKLKYNDITKLNGHLPAFVEYEADEAAEEEMILRSMHKFGEQKEESSPASDEKKAEAVRKEKSSIPALDLDMVEFLRNLTKADLGYYLGDLLKGEYMEAMWDRLSGVVAAIDRMEKENPALLVKKENWNAEVAMRFSNPGATYVTVHEGEVVEEPKQQQK